jgi:methionine-rich copper-binding protein CopC
MPLGGSPLPDATIAVIRQWVTDGALRSASASDSVGKPQLPAVPQLVTSVPQDQEIVTASLATLVLGFDRPLDATRVDAATLRLERASPDSGPELVAASVALADGDDWTVLITPAEPLGPGEYHVVTGGPGNSLAGLDTSDETPVTIVLSFTVEALR